MNANDKMQEEGETEKGEETKQCSMRGENRYGAFKSHFEVLPVYWSSKREIVEE